MAEGLNQELLSILACPKCRADLTLSSDETGLICEVCRLIFPIRNGVPHMILEESRPLGRPSQRAEGPSAAVSGEEVKFLFVEGKNKGETIELEKGYCRGLGRSVDDIEKTAIFSVDSSISLDDSSKKVVMQYLNTQFKTTASTKKVQAKGNQETVGHFLRGPDIRVKDGSVSRLHAMLFFDDSGGVGILDMVSRNGTFVNGAEVESKILKKGDLISFGGSKLRFEG